MYVHSCIPLTVVSRGEGDDPAAYSSASTTFNSNLTGSGSNVEVLYGSGASTERLSSSGQTLTATRACAVAVRVCRCSCHLPRAW